MYLFSHGGEELYAKIQESDISFAEDSLEDSHQEVLYFMR